MTTLDQTIHWIIQSRPSKIAVLTGAGISAESGIPTFRGAGGLWKEYRPEELATPAAFHRDPKTVWEWYEWRRELIREAEPNAAHRALAFLEEALPGGSVTVITQNVDGLHLRAGSRNVIELHGNILRTRCVAPGCLLEPPDEERPSPPRCNCGALLRPDVVWFGEMLPPGAMERSESAVEAADLLWIIGTSGAVYPAAGLIASLTRGKSLEVNPARTALTEVCDFSVQMTAVESVPRIADAILGRLS